ncbi:hypothetical protein [Brevundimonas sp.]|uniref:DUF6197 family protein n=1 Tax=Brevundimonas sp. TaxID=1871086 RepID=UPI0035AFDDE9
MTHSPKQTVPEILNAAADLLEKPGAWTQGTSYAGPNGEWRNGGEPDVTCRCTVGAINEICRWNFDAAIPVFQVFETHIGQDTAKWNDNAYRTQAEVVAALRQAAEKAARPSNRGEA